MAEQQLPEMLRCPLEIGEAMGNGSILVDIGADTEDQKTDLLTLGSAMSLAMGSGAASQAIARASMHNDGKRPLQVVLAPEHAHTPVEKAKSPSLKKLSALKRKAKTRSAAAIQLANGDAGKDEEELTSDPSSSADGGGGKSGTMGRSETAKLKLKALKKAMRKTSFTILREQQEVLLSRQFAGDATATAPATAASMRRLHTRDFSHQGSGMPEQHQHQHQHQQRDFSANRAMGAVGFSAHAAATARRLSQVSISPVDGMDEGSSTAQLSSVEQRVHEAVHARSRKRAQELLQRSPPGSPS